MGKVILFSQYQQVNKCLCSLVKATEQDMKMFYSQGILKDGVCYADVTFDSLEMIRRAKKVKKADLIKLITALYEMDAAKTCLSRCYNG